MSDFQVPWAAKSRALLLPSGPVGLLSPFGPPAGVARAIDAWLAEHGAGADADDAQLRGRCARDAYDAQAALPAGLAHDAPARVVPRHPLSAEPLAEHPIDAAMAAGRWEGFWRRFLGEIQGAGAPHLATEQGYRALFAAFVGAAGAHLASLPAEPRLPDCPLPAHHALTSALVGARHGGQRAALLYLHLGPVQRFVTAARRTHDLWAGSYILSFLAFQALCAVARRLGPDAIVSPDVVRLPLARRLLFGRRAEAQRDPQLLRAALPNKLLAVVPEHAGEACARDAITAVTAAWETMAEGARSVLRAAAGGLSWDAGFDEQIRHHLELDAVLQPWPDDRAEASRLFAELQRGDVLDEVWSPERADRPGLAYGPLFDLTHRVLSAHRTAPSLHGHPGDARPKCTQCGEREQMGPRVDVRQQAAACRAFWTRISADARDGALQITQGEGLCAVCVTKRFAPRAYFGASPGAGLELRWEKEHDRVLLRFPSVPSIAAAPYLLHLKTQREVVGGEADGWLGALHALHDLLGFTPPGNLLPGLGELGRSDALLNHDGSWLYETSYEPDVCWRNHFSASPTDEERAQETYRAIEAAAPGALKALRELCAAAGEARPSAYYAVIQLDGDRMGEWLTGRHPQGPALADLFPELARSAGAQRKRPLFSALHGELSRRLGGLAEALHDVVARHLGRVVYAGGDDLLAFVPLGTALACLAAVRRLFRSPEYLGGRVTVSAGVAIAHWRDPLRGVLQAARLAEKSAKEHERRDRFAIRLDRRSGEDLALILPFEAGGHDVLDAVRALVRSARRTALQPADGPQELGSEEGPGEPQETDGAQGPEGPREEEGLISPSVAYKLADELRLLGAAPDDTLLRAFWHRAEILLGYRSKRDGRRTRDLPAGIRALFEAQGEDPSPALEPASLVDLLLFVRFLLREEKGLGGLHERIAERGVDA